MTGPGKESEVERLLRETFHATQLHDALSRSETGSPLSSSRMRELRIWRWVAPVAAASAVVLVSAGVFASRHSGSTEPLVAPASISAAAATTAPAPATPSTSPTASRSFSTDDPAYQKAMAAQGTMDQAAPRIETIARAHDSAFDLLSIDGFANTLTIYRADPAPDRRAALYAPAIPKGVTVRYARSMLNHTQVNDLMGLVQDQTANLAKHGVLVTGGGELTAGGPFMIGYEPRCQKPGDQQLKPFEKYGRGTAVFVPREMAVAMDAISPSPATPPKPACPVAVQ